MHQRVTAGELARVLHDHCHVLLSRVLRVLGEERTITLLVEALTIESNGGLWLKDRSRRRTLCGTFLQLEKEQASPEEKRTIFR
jgi:hypothetical protein